MSQTTIERVRRYVAKCPPAIAGQRGHDATYKVASIVAHGFALGEPQALDLMREWNRGCVPPWSEAELLHKIRSAAIARHDHPRGYLLGDRQGSGSGSVGKKSATVFLPPAPPKPAFCPMVLKRIAGRVTGVGDVVEFVRGRSVLPVDGQDCASVLRFLYPKGAGEKVLVFSDMKSQGQLLWTADTGHLVVHGDFPTGRDGVWFLAQPVDGVYHANPRLGGKMSRRSEESVTAWRYVVLESDEAEPEDWLRCLIQLPLRIASICESGGRSIHALVRIDAATKEDWDAQVRRIKPVLVTLGADSGALSAVRLTRLPQARRGARVQRLLYLNPAPDEKTLYSR